jgi:hypothetical protein
MNELLCEVLNECFEISTKTKADVFFYYSPHVNAFSVSVHRDGWTQTTAGDMEWLAMTNQVTEGNLNIVLVKLFNLAYELGVE